MKTTVRMFPQQEWGFSFGAVSSFSAVSPNPRDSLPEGPRPRQAAGPPEEWRRQGPGSCADFWLRPGPAPLEWSAAEPVDSPGGS